MKKIFAILLVLVLSVSMITPVFAARDYDYDDYDYSDYSFSDDDMAEIALAGGVLALIAGFGVLGSMVSIAISILSIIAMWKIFTKAGEEGWKSIIPIYNAVILFKIIGLSPWLLFICLAVIIPIVGPIAVLVLAIIQCVKLSQAFGKSGGFTAGLIFLNTIFIMILAFGDSQYIGPNNYNTNSPIDNEE